MSEVFRELSFHYNGERLTLVPSLALLRRIKARGINNVLLANGCVRGGVDIEDLAVAHCEFLREAGYRVNGEPDAAGNVSTRPITEEESYLYLTGNQTAEIQEFQMAYCNAVLPGVSFGKKPEGREQKEVKKPAKT